MEREEQRVLVGSHTAISGGSGLGIGVVHLAPNGQPTLSEAASADSPTFLVAHPFLPIVYALLEANATVRAYRDPPDGPLSPVGQAWGTGEFACYATVDPKGRYLIVACWGDGAILLYELDKDGMIINRLPAPPATNPHPEPDRVSRAHAARVLFSGKVMTCDFGFDLMRIWHYAPGVGLVPEQDVVLPSGARPRHVALHPGGRIYVIAEVWLTVLVISEDAQGTYRVEANPPATRTGPLRGDKAAEISITDNARTIHVGIRGSNRIATLSVDPSGAHLEAQGEVDCGGDTPRYHAEAQGLLVVANEKSDELAVFDTDPVTGVPGALVGSARVGTPTCLLVGSPKAVIQ